MKASPKIQRYMTSNPKTVSPDLALTDAMNLMKENGFRHLPVQSDGRLHGIISDRDITLAIGISPTSHADRLKVSQVMTRGPFVARPDSELSDIVGIMADHRYGCAIVIEPNGKVCGIFTTHDAIRALGSFMKEKNT